MNSSELKLLASSCECRLCVRNNVQRVVILDLRMPMGIDSGVYQLQTTRKLAHMVKAQLECGMETKTDTHSRLVLY